MAGGNSGGVESYLPIAAALAATIATDGAASPWLVEAMGATAAGALTSGAAAAAASGVTAGVLGQDVGKAALTGAVSGGIGGALGAAAPLDSAAAAAGGSGGGGAFVPAAGSGASFAAPVAGEVALTPAVGGGIASGFGGQTTQAGMLAAQEAGMSLPQSQQAAMLAAQDAGFNAPQLSSATGYQAPTAGSGVGSTAGTNTGVGGTPVNNPSTGGSAIGNWMSNNKGITAIGGTALLGALINQDNKKYGTPATEEYDGPLSQFNYDPKKYTPLATAQPSPAYQAKYPNYKAAPYNPYASAAQGGVVAMADGGIAMANPSIGPVEQMSRDNATGNNMMFPQAGINSPSFANATNRPMAQNMVPSAADTNVDPYTGTERFAEGGTAEAKGIPLQAMPNLITQNSVANNNALTQDLVARMAARNAMNPVPDQVAPVVPMQSAGIMAAAPYATPTFNRPTNVAPIEFQNPMAIVGTKAYNDEQARLAAEAAEAARQAELATNQDVSQFAYATGGGIGHLGSYSDGGRLLKGPGDGMSDNIPAQIGAKQPARLADGEFVVPADVVSHLGNGSTDAGAKKLYAMMDRVRAARTGNKKQGKQIKAEKYLKT